MQFIPLILACLAILSLGSATVVTSQKATSPHVLFVSIPLQGHLNPLLAQAEALSKRGIKTTIATPTLLKDYVLKNLPVNGNYFDIGHCTEFENSYDSNLQLAREAEPRTSAGIIFAWIAEAHSCMFQPLSAAVKQTKKTQSDLKQCMSSANSDAAQNACQEKYNNNENVNQLAPVDLIVSDIVSLAGIDIGREFGIPVVLNNADLLYVNSARFLPGSNNVPQMFETSSLHSIRSEYWIRLARNVIFYPIRFIIEALFSKMDVAQSFEKERQKSNLPHADFLVANSDYLVIQNTAFGLEYPQSTPSNIFMVGPCVQTSQSTLSPDDLDWLNLSEDPVTFLSMGTLAQLSNEQTKTVLGGFLSSPLDVISDNSTSTSGDEKLPLRVIWKISKSHWNVLAQAAVSQGVWLESLGPISRYQEAQQAYDAKLAINETFTLTTIPSSKIRVTEWVSSQAALLEDPRVRLFVSHCGINSGHEAVLYGGGHLQVLCIPMFGDQRDMAIRLRDAGVGAYIEKFTFTSSEFSSMTAALLVYGDSSVGRSRGTAAKMAVKLAGGVNRAADIVESTVRAAVAARSTSSNTASTHNQNHIPFVPVIDSESHNFGLANEHELASNQAVSELVHNFKKLRTDHLVSWHHTPPARFGGAMEAGDLSTLLIPTESRLGLLESYKIDMFLCFVLLMVCSLIVLWLLCCRVKGQKKTNLLQPGATVQKAKLITTWYSSALVNQVK